jgi:hypothetical protein
MTTEIIIFLAAIFLCWRESFLLLLSAFPEEGEKPNSMRKKNPKQPALSLS